MQIAIRADSGARLGSGHLIRCLTLAGELRARGASVCFVSRQYQGHFIQRIENEGYPVVKLEVPPAHDGADRSEGPNWLGLSQNDDASQTRRSLSGKSMDWLVVDHYGLDHDWERQLRMIARRVLVIDDLADRRHDCDLLVDQNYFGAATSDRYNSLVGPATVRLLGPQFALLQPGYALLRSLVPPRSGIVHRVLVFFGGSDLPNDTQRVLDALSCPELDHLAVDVVAGQNHPDRRRLQEWVGARREAALHVGLPSLAGLMARADLAIGGGGSTTWERACLALPAVVVTLADNQAAFTAALAADGYQLSLGRGADVRVNQWRAALIDLVANPDRLAAMSRRAMSLTDGGGAKHVAEAMFSAGKSEISPAQAAISATARELRSIAAQPLRISLLSDSTSWLNDHLPHLVAGLRERGHRVSWVHEPAAVSAGEVCFVIGCSRLLKAAELQKNPYTLVVHESALPEGRGWSPMTWQVLEDRRRIVVTLFEAVEKVDAGRIHLQTTIALTGTELIEEWRMLQAQATQELCMRWVDEFPHVVNRAREQSGVPSFYERRGPVDSKLDPNRSLADQFDLLRTVDNVRYPAYFEYRGKMYRLLIEQDGRGDGAD